MRVCQGVQIILRDALVEFVVFFFRHVFLCSQPNGLLRVDLFPFIHSLLLGLLLFLLFFFIVILGLNIILLLFLLIVLVVVVILFSFRIDLFFHFDINRKLDELGILFGSLFQFILRQVVVSIFFQVQRHSRTTAKRVAPGIIHHSERGICT